MRKLLLAVIFCLISALLLVACESDSFFCSACMKKCDGEKHEEKVGNIVITYCDDCYKEFSKDLESDETAQDGEVSENTKNTDSEISKESESLAK